MNKARLEEASSGAPMADAAATSWEAGEIAWRPSPDLIAKSNLQQFMREHKIGSLDELQRRSTSDLHWFWKAVLCDLDIRFRKPFDSVLDLSDGPEWAHWCKGGIMNIVDNCLDKYAGTPTDNKIAVAWEGENGETKRLSYHPRA